MGDKRNRDEEYSRGKVNALVEGAVLAAIATILALVGLFIPPLSLITNFLWTIPLIVICLRHDVRSGIMVLVVTSVLLMMFATPLRGLFLVLEYGFMAIIYGYAFRKNISVGKTLFYGCVAATIGTVLVILFSFMLTGFSPEYFEAQANEAMEMVLDLYRQTGVLERLPGQGVSPDQIRAMMPKMLSIIISLIPGLMIISSLSSAFLSFFLSRIILRKMQIQLPNIPPFKNWRIPWYYIWGFIIAFGFFLLGDYTKIQLLKTLGLNVLLIHGPVFFVIGLAVVKFYLEKFKVGKGLRLVFIVLVLIYFPFAFMSLATLGMFDMLFDYRRLGDEKRTI